MYNNLDFILMMIIITWLNFAAHAVVNNITILLLNQSVSKKDSIIVRQMLEDQTPATVKDQGAGNCHSSKLFSWIIKELQLYLAGITDGSRVRKQKPES